MANALECKAGQRDSVVEVPGRIGTISIFVLGTKRIAVAAIQIQVAIVKRNISSSYSIVIRTADSRYTSCL